MNDLSDKNVKTIKVIKDFLLIDEYAHIPLTDWIRKIPPLYQQIYAFMSVLNVEICDFNIEFIDSIVTLTESHSYQLDNSIIERLKKIPSYALQNEIKIEFPEAYFRFGYDYVRLYERNRDVTEKNKYYGANGEIKSTQDFIQSAIYDVQGIVKRLNVEMKPALSLTTKIRGSLNEIGRLMKNPGATSIKRCNAEVEKLVSLLDQYDSIDSASLSVTLNTIIAQINKIIRQVHEATEFLPEIIEDYVITDSRILWKNPLHVYN